MLFNKHKYTFNTSKKILHKIKKRWVVISIALLSLIGGMTFTSSTINVSAENNYTPIINHQNNIDQSNSVTQQAYQFHSQLINNNIKYHQSTIKLGAESNDNNWDTSSDTIPNYSDSTLNSFNNDTVNYINSDYLSNNYSSNSNSSDNYSASDYNYSNPFSDYSDSYDNNQTGYSYSDGDNSGISNYSDLSTSNSISDTYSFSDALSGSSDNYVTSDYNYSSPFSNYSDNVSDTLPNYSDKFFNNYSDNSMNLSDTTDNIVPNPYSDDYLNSYSNDQINYSDPSTDDSISDTYLFSDNTLPSFSDSYSDSDNILPNYSDSFAINSNTATSNNYNYISSSASNSVSDFKSNDIEFSSNASIISDIMSDNINNDSTSNVDTTHKYLIPGTNNRNVTFGSVNSDGNYSDYSDLDNQMPLFVKIVGNKTVFGYHFDQIITNLNDVSDADKEWVFSDELSNSPKASVNDVQELKNFKQTIMNHYYTPTEISQIKSIKQRYNYLEQYENSNLISNPNQIKAYRQHVIDWINFYRSLYGYQPVTEDISFDQVAQKGANNGSDPEDLIEGDPSSLTASNPSDVGLYVTDADDVDHNGVPGHRISVLNPRASKIGVGIKGSQDTLYFDFGENSPFIETPMNISYPNTYLFPINDVNQGSSDYFGYAFIVPHQVDTSDSDYYSPMDIKNPGITIHDDTSNINVNAYNVHTDNTDFNGETYSGAVYYNVDTDELKPNHQYTITVTGQGIPNGYYTYTTKLFDINS